MAKQSKNQIFQNGLNMARSMFMKDNNKNS